MNAIVGYTGFVGSNLYSPERFQAAYHSKNIEAASGTKPDLLVYSGVRAEKYLANNEPEKDLRNIEQARMNIESINPRRLILISTIDVFKTPVGVDEKTEIDLEGLQPYGYHRYLLEQWVREHYPDALIVRLPGLFGKNLKKNFIYDFINRIPSMLKAEKYDELVRSDKDFYPDGKAQITGIYDDDFDLVAIKDFTISYNNSEKNREVTDRILEEIALKICDAYDVKVERFLINPTGRFEIGGFEGDAGLTGRKIVVDAYQSFANVGGGCMNGKDPTKVDLSGAYMARVYAKELLKKYDLKWCEVQLSYAIGLRRPLAIYIDSDKGNLVPEEEMYERGEPKHIIEELGLKDVCYERQAMFGHFYD